MTVAMNEAEEHVSVKPYYPVLLSVKSRVCLVVGGGSVGERKVKGLLGYGATIRLVANELTDWLRSQVGDGVVDYVADHFQEEQLDGIDLVFAATNDRGLNRRIASKAHKRRIWCNTATDPDEGSFVLPAVLHKGSLTIAVGTSGASPAVARQIRDKLEEEFDNAWIVFLEIMSALRRIIQSRGLDTEKNQMLFRELARLPLVEWIRTRDRDAVVKSVCAACDPYVDLDEMNRIWDRVWKAFSS
jgi:precorrin-2 dehydrogenase/sirohydrochlorin ferrochelatase